MNRRYNKEEFISMLKKNAIRGCKSNSLTYKKYDKSNLEYLLVTPVTSKVFIAIININISSNI